MKRLLLSVWLLSLSLLSAVAENYPYKSDVLWDRGVGDMYDVHNYPVTSMILPENNGNRISVLGEFGGYGWAIKEHIWKWNSLHGRNSTT